MGAFQPKDVYPCTVDEVNWNIDVSMQNLFGHLCSGQTFAHDNTMNEHEEFRIARQKQKRKAESLMFPGPFASPSHRTGSPRLNRKHVIMNPEDAIFHKRQRLEQIHTNYPEARSRPFDTAPITLQQGDNEHIISQSICNEEILSLRDRGPIFDDDKKGPQLSLSDSDFESSSDAGSGRETWKRKMRYRKEAYRFAKTGKWASSGMMELQSTYLKKEVELD